MPWTVEQEFRERKRNGFFSRHTRFRIPQFLPHHGCIVQQNYCPCCVILGTYSHARPANACLCEKHRVRKSNEDETISGWEKKRDEKIDDDRTSVWFPRDSDNLVSIFSDWFIDVPSIRSILRKLVHYVIWKFGKIFDDIIHWLIFPEKRGKEKSAFSLSALLLIAGD